MFREELKKYLFVNGENGYHTFRIPSMVKAENGDILAFACGRMYNEDDFGKIHLLLKKSYDNGKTWSKLKVVCENGDLVAAQPSAVVDTIDKEHTNRIWLSYNTVNNSEQNSILSKGVREIWMKYSDDNGETWSQGRNITSYIHRPYYGEYKFPEKWGHYAIGPGHAIQLKRGKYKGRLLFVGNHTANNTKLYICHSYYSDDHGKTWLLGDNVDYDNGNECQAVELSDGRVMLNARIQDHSRNYRMLSTSDDGGETWGKAYVDKNLPDPTCQGSILRYSFDPNYILFTNNNSIKHRINMTIRLSKDDGQTWEDSKLIQSAESKGYSDMVVQQDGKIGILHEYGDDTSTNLGLMYVIMELTEQ